jgi:hypothetical protein
LVHRRTQSAAAHGGAVGKRRKPAPHLSPRGAGDSALCRGAGPCIPRVRAIPRDCRRMQERAYRPAYRGPVYVTDQAPSPVPGRSRLTDSLDAGRGGWHDQGAAEADAHGHERGFRLLAWECSHLDPARITPCASDGIAPALQRSLRQPCLTSAPDLEDNGSRHLRDLHAMLDLCREVRVEPSTGFGSDVSHRSLTRTPRRAGRRAAGCGPTIRVGPR